MTNPFYRDLDGVTRGREVFVKTGEDRYVGRVKRWNFNEHQVLLYDARRVSSRSDEGELCGAVAIENPEVVERIDGEPELHEIPIVDVRPSPYSSRNFDDIEEFARTLREGGNLITFPEVRPVGDGEYEILRGHRRYEAARRASFDEIPCTIRECDEWMALRIFVDEHIPLPEDDDSRHNEWYTDEAITRAIEKMDETWSREDLCTISVLEPYIRRTPDGLPDGYPFFEDESVFGPKV